MSCPKGEYYCRTSGKCKSIPAGHKVTADGDLIKEDKKKSYSDIITKNASEFGDTLNKSKQVKKFKNSVEDFGKTGKIDIKSLVNNNKDLPDFLKNTGKNALVKTLQGLTTKLKTEQYSDWRSEFKIEEETTLDEGKKKLLAGLLAVPYLAKKFLSPTVDRLLNQGRKTKIGGDTRSGMKTEGLKQARKNIGMDPDKPSCWKGYKAKGTKKKGGKEVPNCVKEEIQGGVNVETYTDGIQFNEIETVDIIKTKPLDPSNWRSELINTNTGH